MKVSAYHRPATLSEALRTLAQEGPGAKVLAGGTDLVLMLKRREEKAPALVDISALRELRYIREEDGIIRMGALATHTDMLESRLLQQKAWPLVEAAATIGGVQIRNVGTLGGNLAHASPAADLVPPLFALDAEVRLSSATGERSLSITGLASGPKRNTLRPGELIREVSFQAMRTGDVGFFHKLGERGALAISVICLAFFGRPAGLGNLSAARIAMGSVAPTVIRAPEAEAILTGGRLTPDRIAEASEAAARAASPIDDVRAPGAYRREMVSALLRAELERALASRIERPRAEH